MRSSTSRLLAVLRLPMTNNASERARSFAEEVRVDPGTPEQATNLGRRKANAEDKQRVPDLDQAAVGQQCVAGRRAVYLGPVLRSDVVQRPAHAATPKPHVGLGSMTVREREVEDALATPSGCQALLPATDSDFVDSVECIVQHD